MFCRYILFADQRGCLFKYGERGFYHSLRSYYSGLYSRYKYLHKPCLTVSYEELCSFPEQVMARIMRYLGLDFELEQLDWSSHDHHNVNGNKRTRTSSQSAILWMSVGGASSTPGSVLL